MGKLGTINVKGVVVLDLRVRNQRSFMIVFFVYILQCQDNTYYTGYTNDIKKRLETHNAGKASKYTRGRLPVKLVYAEEFDSKSDALKREIEIKKLTRKQKERLMQTSPNRIS